MCAVLGCTRRRHQGVTFGERCVGPLWLAFANLSAERISYFRAAVNPSAKLLFVRSNGAPERWHSLRRIAVPPAE